jgi:hypothetical protein
MPRLRRLHLPAIPHDLTQRGNYRQKNNFRAEDHRLYPQLLKDYSSHHGVRIRTAKQELEREARERVERAVREKAAQNGKAHDEAQASAGSAPGLHRTWRQRRISPIRIRG